MRLPLSRQAAAAMLASAAVTVPAFAEVASLSQTEEETDMSRSRIEPSPGGDAAANSATESKTAMSKVSDAIRRNASKDRLLPRLSRRSPPSSSSGEEKQSSPTTAAHRPNHSTDLEEMVPITNELLREHYAKFPNPKVSSILHKERSILENLHTGLMTKVPQSATVKSGENAGQSSHDVMSTILNETVPTGLDNAMYTARCACEEAAARCAEISYLRDFEPRFLAAAEKFESFQARQREHVSEVINEFLPQDFRGNLFNVVRQRSERNNVQAVQELMANGGTVRQKYSLLWEQQWKRRENLAMIGNATGIWRWVVRYLAGVPQPLLTFAKNINAPKGPTEALREKFGGALTELSTFAIQLNALCSAVAFSERVDNAEEIKEQLIKSMELYDEEVDKFVALLQDVIMKSPFFIRPDQIASMKPNV